MFQETGLESIVIPANVTDIPMATFRLCKKLKKIIIYSPRAEIYPDAFEYCSSDLVMQGYMGSTTQEDIDTFYPSQTLTPSNTTNTATSKRNKTKKD